MIGVLDDAGRQLPFEHLPVFSLESAVAYVDTFWDELPERASTIVVGDGKRDCRCYRVSELLPYRYLNLDWINADRT